ncbi:acetate/propionate family kinase [Aurantimonas sp. 22II-16-19i]|uniref:acetate/propionate family kinase n=1 Tax=Aurantimonas sp. 22II-16-19i TaxID=1317114 RepID=UPI0009F7C1FF|nr:acetate/propionate family kinase [Aurantimonas sp. 22II-16-19i]ORE98899.1 acetate kinase [Aurantimonas sp. 22II-16-19i]
MTKAVLALNAGSSSIKFALYEAAGAGDLRRVAKGSVDDTGEAPALSLSDRDEPLRIDPGASGERRLEQLFAALFEAVEERLGGRELVAVGHRIVHGGMVFSEPAVIDDAVLSALEGLTPLAPLHQPRGLEPVHEMRAMRPELLQVACFDTAFHHHLEPPVSRYAIPRRFEAEGVRKYGFHGLSYEFVAGRLAEVAPELCSSRVVVAHLGNGASLCAMRDGRSVDTTMGFSALDGLVMGTRSGAIDPGVLLYLQSVHGLDAGELEDLLYHRSGLLGVSGISGDVRTLSQSGDPRAKEALDLFAFRASRETAAMANSLEGLDALVFTGGIGEHSPLMRAAICARLAWLGVEIDGDANARGEACVSAGNSRVRVLVVPTDEEQVIARHTLRRIVARA